MLSVSQDAPWVKYRAKQWHSKRGRGGPSLAEGRHFDNSLNKSSAVAEMGDRGLATIDMGQKEGGRLLYCAPFAKSWDPV